MLRLFKRLLNKIGTAGQQLKYGAIKGTGLYIEATIAASVPFKANYGRFVYVDANGNVDLVVAATATIFGSVVSTGTSSSTAAADKATVNISRDMVYRIPILSGTYAHSTYRGKVCDLGGTTGSQGAVLATNTNHHVIIVDGDVANNKWVDVMMNIPINIGR